MTAGPTARSKRKRRSEQLVLVKQRGGKRHSAGRPPNGKRTGSPHKERPFLTMSPSTTRPQGEAPTAEGDLVFNPNIAHGSAFPNEWFDTVPESGNRRQRPPPISGKKEIHPGSTRPGVSVESPVDSVNRRPCASWRCPSGVSTRSRVLHNPWPLGRDTP
jgi:hypothetical protein